MRKVLLIIGIFLISVIGAQAALDMKVNPMDLALPDGGSATAVVTVKNKGEPVPGLPLAVLQVCKELGGSPYSCGAGDDPLTTEVTVSVASPTDDSGEAIVTIEHNGEGSGVYHYTICDASGGSCSEGGASVTGDANMIPEFSAIAAGIVLIGAGLFIYRKRK